MSKPLFLFYLLLYGILIGFSLSVFFIFKPFPYVDNDASQIVCTKSGGSFTIGPNYIYTFGSKLDSFNDAKARKLCEYGVIRDYGNTYQTPQRLNYRFKPVFVKDSSWGDSILMGVAVFLLGATFIEMIKKGIIFLAKQKERHQQLSLMYFICSIFLGIVFFAIVLRAPTQNAFCTRKIARQVVNFRNSTFKYGVISVPEEDIHIRDSGQVLYQKCLVLTQ